MLSKIILVIILSTCPFYGFSQNDPCEKSTSGLLEKRIKRVKTEDSIYTQVQKMLCRYISEVKQIRESLTGEKVKTPEAILRAKHKLLFDIKTRFGNEIYREVKKIIDPPPCEPAGNRVSRKKKSCKNKNYNN